MGSDFYRVDLSAHHECSKDEAIQRALWRGCAYKTTNSFFSTKGPWLELHLSIVTIHPDVCVGWGPSFALRVIDEGVTSWDHKPRIEHEKSPLRQHYPTLWEAPFTTGGKSPSVVLIAQAEYRPDPMAKPRQGGKADAIKLVVFIKREYAPNLDGITSWESRAWPGRDEPRFESIDQQRILRAELRPLGYSMWLSESGVQTLEKSAWKKLAAPLWKKEPPNLSFDVEGRLWMLREDAATLVEKDWSAKKILQKGKPYRLGFWKKALRDQQGVLWMVCSDGLLRQSEAGEFSKLTSAHGLAGNSVADLCLNEQGRVVVATGSGVSIDRGGKWENLKDQLVDRDCFFVYVNSDGALWAAGRRGLTRIDKDGTITPIKTRPGEIIRRCVPLPNGGAWVITHLGEYEIAPRAARMTPSEAIRRLAPPDEISAMVRQGDALWLTTKHLLLCLRNGQRPRAYRWMQPYPDAKANAPEFHAVYPTPDQGLWLGFGNGVFPLSAEDLAAIDATAPINAAVCPEIPLFYWPGAAPANSTTSKPTLNLKGKSVVLTGTLTMPRAAAEKLLRAKGAIVSSSLSGKTSYLLAGAKAGVKLAQAKALGVALLTEEELLAP